MKKSVVLLVMGMVFAGATQASDLSDFGFEKGAHWAQLDTFKIDENMDFAGANVGSVYVDYDKKQVVVRLSRVTPCKSDMMCPMGFPSYQISLPIVSIETTTCNVRLITALVDQMPVDGAREVLLLEDHRSDNCMYFMPVPSLEISHEYAFYDRINGREVRMNSKLSSWEGLAPLGPIAQ